MPNPLCLWSSILTDTGHIGDGVSASWTRLADGKPDMVKRVDFFYRAAHDVPVAGKAFAETYYAAKVEHAYFDGCSIARQRINIAQAGNFEYVWLDLRARKDDLAHAHAADT